MVDLGAVITVVLVLGAAGGSWLQGRNNGSQTALSTASDIVGMLAVQVSALEGKARCAEADRDAWKARYDALAGYREASERCRQADCPGRSARAEGSADG